MEFLTIVLAGLLGLGSPVGTVFDTAAEKAVLSGLHSADNLTVRMDNSPNYLWFGGKIDRLRVAGRGLYLTPDLRIDTLELETDRLNVDLDRLREEGSESLPLFLREPLQGAVRLVLTEADLNRFIQSPAFLEQVGVVGEQIAEGTAAETQGDRYEVVNPRLDFLGNDRLAFQVEIRDRRDGESLQVRVNSGLAVISGHRLELVEPKISLGDRELPPKAIELIAKAVRERANLQQYEDRGLLARILEFSMTDEAIEIAGFIKIQDASAPISP
ncbi:LmeA family phospholipid-binding protein [Oxynema aestuarii]|jgi:hypothetical protein|uniref:DUF2993 domain-containing protein n=1 Tax=Oxynema aestuarii AP17 TaxID=2064643 RepID=A0A6H1U5U3_9CYAN|nr:DUF2993 domain-containing protein [Oxynema aestuarii]QIZ72999.1 DUF2993 domain-containing protein [Oxynema aestuarii AP17]RMH75286.1 MAG: DUF2993 domain-containing protein [Cyanobacteria bacterium J007]